VKYLQRKGELGKNQAVLFRILNAGKSERFAFFTGYTYKKQLRINLQQSTTEIKFLKNREVNSQYEPS